MQDNTNTVNTVQQYHEEDLWVCVYHWGVSRGHTLYTPKQSRINKYISSRLPDSFPPCGMTILWNKRTKTSFQTSTHTLTTADSADLLLCCHCSFLIIFKLKHVASSGTTDTFLNTSKVNPSAVQLLSNALFVFLSDWSVYIWLIEQEGLWLWNVSLHEGRLILVCVHSTNEVLYIN